MSKHAPTVWLIIAITLLFVVFAGTPDLQDAVITALTKNCES